MTAPLPNGLIRVVSATRLEVPSDPADIIYERKQALHNFWKVYDTQSRATRDASNIRCRQLFWRVWSDRQLSVSLSQDTMFQLWMQCQRNFDLTPFDLQIESSSSSTFENTIYHSAPGIERRLSKDSQRTQTSDTISPPLSLSDDDGFEDSVEKTKKSSKRRQPSRVLSRDADSRPGVARTTSSDANRKRPSITATTARGKARPSVTRKRSSQSTQPSEPPKPRRSIIKSPKSPNELDEKIENHFEPKNALLAQMTTSPQNEAELAARRLSAFQLPSASSWQSVESHDHRAVAPAGSSAEAGVNPLMIDKNFRERFVETQKQLRSSTNLAEMNKTMRKTGSVVRFADDVDVPEDFRKLRRPDREELGTSPHSRPEESPQPQTTSKGWQTSAFLPDQAEQTNSQAWRPDDLKRHNSIGSVAAVSDESDDDENSGITMQLPRNRSQLSLGIANLKRSQSIGEQGSVTENGAEDEAEVVTSPKIEQEQEALISGRKPKLKSVEEEKLLAMGRKDGVTRAGGVNLPKELRVKGPRRPDDRFEAPEQILF